MRASSTTLVKRLMLIGGSLSLLTTLSCRQRQSALNFTVSNQTRITITSIYLSPHDAESWEENVLGGFELGPTATLEIKFDPASQHEKWDLRVGNNQKKFAEWRDLDLQRISKIVFRLREGTMIADVQ
jgi:hypothetical protein